MKLNLAILLLVGLIFRLLSLNIDFAFDNDVLTFQIWGANLWRYGFSGFFEADFFSDYPPVYLYVLYIVGMFREVLGLDFLSPMLNFITFLPAMVFDLLIGVLIFRETAKHTKSETFPLVAAALWVFNPSIILISSIWGQVESVFVFILFLSLINLRSGKLLPSYILFGLAILTKPQSLFLGPVYLYSAYEFIMNNERKAALKYTALSIGCGILAMVLVSLPFGLVATFNQLVDGIGLYGFASVNAFNMWALLGQNWTPVYTTFFGLSIAFWGYAIALFIIAASIAALHIDSTKHGGRHFYLIVALLFASIFVFSTRMHERYLFPALLFLLVYYAQQKERKDLILYSLFSLSFFVNCIQVLRWLRGHVDIHAINFSVMFVSLSNIVLTVVLTVNLVQNLRMSARQRRQRTPVKPVTRRSRHEPFIPIPVMKMRDFVLLCVLVLAYGTVAFVNLGDIRAPQTAWVSAENEEAWLDFGSLRHISEFQFQTGAMHGIPFTVYSSIDNHNWYEEVRISPDHVYPFAWRSESLNTSARFVRIVPELAGLRIQEAAFRDARGEILEIASHSEGSTNLFDEQHLVPIRRGFMNSTYFDEIYHARAGYEFVNRLSVFEWTHPPLGKVFKAASIRLFGMTPFAYRLPGTVFGIMMIPFMYFFGRALFKSNELGLFAAFIFTFDFMLFAQTRMATIDTYVTFFVIAMYFFMYKYVSEQNKSDLKLAFLWLALSGAAMGLAIASKWQGVYAALGLPVLFFPALYGLYQSDKSAAKKTFLACFGFFVALPLVIYLLSYIPFVLAEGGGGLRTVWNNQVSMFRYHSQLVATHPWASNWWSWPLVLRPLWQYITYLPDGNVQTMSSIGSPAVWWFGILATVFMLYKVVLGRLKEKPCIGYREAVFLLVAYAAQFLPWVPVTRLTFIYHYFPSVPFVVLIITWVLKHHLNDRRLMLAYACVVFFMFVLFYPVISGMAVSPDFVLNLQWLPGWTFVWIS